MPTPIRLLRTAPPHRRRQTGTALLVLLVAMSGAGWVAGCAAAVQAIAMIAAIRSRPYGHPPVAANDNLRLPRGLQPPSPLAAAMARCYNDWDDGWRDQCSAAARLR